jgi:Carboxypeptidase regulatory-like domain
MRRLISKNLLLSIWSFFIIVTMFVSLSVCRAQDYASITGVVTDPTGAVVPGVTVTLTNQLTSASYKTETNAIGSYIISNVAPGPGYKVTFSINGFKSVVITGIYMNVTATATVNAKLVIGGTAETVEVSAASNNVTLNTTDATIGNNFEVDMVNELPIEIRDTPAVLFTQQPGVTSDGAVTGARTDQTHVTLDGLDVDDPATGEFGVVTGNAPVDSVQEFRGVTAGETSNFDSGGGGQFQLVTKSGTNSFHGSVFEYHRDTDTEANYWFNNNAGIPRPPLIRNQFGGNIGGPIKKDKMFFFFEYNGRRDDLADAVEQTVPTPSYLAGNISYINDSNGNSCPTTSTYLTEPSCISSVSAATIASNYDPQNIGQSPSLAAFINKRYPAGNDLTGGDGINTEGFRFNAPITLKENDYVARLDYSLTSDQKLWARGSLQSQRQGDDVNYATPIQFPGDPTTRWIDIASYGWVVGHDWAIGANKSNQASFGATVSRLDFPSLFDPTGALMWGFGPLTEPYLGTYNAQGRVDPTPQFRDDFSWHKGTHTFQFGGTFKYLTPYDNYILNDYTPGLGIGGNLSQLDPGLRPSDILDNGSSTPNTLWDSALTFDLGRFADIGAIFNYDANGTVVTEGAGATRKYRNYESEMYFSDSWKVTPDLTLTFGLRYQLFTVPYEMNGIESIQVNSETGKPLGFNEYFFKDRLPQNNASASGNNVIPDLEYVLGGKANHNAVGGYYQPSYTDFAPRFAFAWNPSFNHKLVISGSAGIQYDHTVVEAIQYFQDHSSYLFQNTNNTLYGNGSNPEGSLATDPRFSSITAIPTPPAAPPFTATEVPYVSNGVPYGAGINTFSTAVDPSLTTPYSIMLDFGVQHDVGGGFLLKVNYAGRLGRRLLAQVDASQVLDFPDPASGEHYQQAFANVVNEIRAGDNPLSIPAEPWFENQVYPGLYQYFGPPNYPTFANNTQLLGYFLGNYFYNGDIGDFTNSLTGPEFGIPVIGTNAVVPSQFSSNDYYTNKGFSNYHGLLVTLHKNAGFGLQFDLNYTWSHSIDNFSLIANGQSNYTGEFICDATKPRECRGNSDFDLTQVFNGNFIYSLPFGRGKTFGSTIPIWLDEAIGGWQISGLPTWQTGSPYYANSTAYGAGYATLAPAILVGSPALVASHAHKDAATGLVFGYTNPVAADSAFIGPIGLTLGQRNELRGPHFSDLDLGVGKTFPIYSDRYRLVFRCDAFNAINHASFSNPNATIISSQFGVISSTSSTPRVLQGALRVEF